MVRKLTMDFMSLFCEKNSDDTKTLRLKGNELSYRIKQRIVDDDMIKIVIFLNHNTNITKLELPYNEIGDDGLKVLVNEHLAHKNSITYLSLVGNNITYRGIKTLCTAAPTLILKTLRLTANKIGFEGGAALETLLLHVKTLEHLDVGDCNQTLGSVPYFCASLRADIGGNDTLKTMDISNIIPTSDRYQFPPSLLADHLGELIKMNFTLVEIHVQKCQFDGHDVELLLNGLRANKTLLLLDIAFNRINNYGAELLAEYLKTKPNLLGLNISGNSIGDIGARALSFGLPFSKIRLLDISTNKISDNAMAQLLFTIKKKFILRFFYLWGNDLGQKSLKILNRQMNAGVYIQENVDFKIYYADDRFQAAKYFSNEYKSRYYCQLTHNQVQELRIKRNFVESQFCDHKAKIKFNYYDRIEGTTECQDDIRYEQHDADDYELWKKCFEQELDKLEKLKLEENQEENEDAETEENFEADESEGLEEKEEGEEEEEEEEEDEENN